MTSKTILYFRRGLARLFENDWDVYSLPPRPIDFYEIYDDIDLIGKPSFKITGIKA